MISQITKALSSGFTSRQIIDFIIKKFPEHSDKIKSALATGFTVEQVIKFLDKGKRALNEPSESQGTTEFEQTRGTDIRRRENVNKGAMAAGALALGPLASQAAGAALSRAVPHALQSLIPQFQNAIAPSVPNQPMQQSPQLQVPFQEEQQKTTLPQQPPNQSVNPNPTQLANLPQAKTNPIENVDTPSTALWNQLISGKTKKINPEIDALLRVAKKMQTTGEIKSKEDFDKLYQLFEEKKASGMNLPKALKEATSQFDKEKLNTNESQNLLENEKLVDKEEVKKPTISKNETVATPNGIGEVKEIRNGQALVEVDGKLHKVNEEELQASPLPEKDLADLHDDLMQGIEKETGEEISRMVDFAGYDPKTNTLAFLPHTGSLYTYSDISPEDKDLLTSILSTRKTSGENFIGAWKAGSKSPIGAALSVLIKRLQAERGGKGNEYSGKFETVYKSREPAILASKKKKAEEEKRRKKNAKA